jgi:HrpA-like RNA helicase
MDRPSRDSLVHAMEQLYALSALDDQGMLTKLGRDMAEFPLDPVYSRILLMSRVSGDPKERRREDFLREALFMIPHPRRRF